MFGLKIEKKRKSKDAWRAACLRAHNIDLVVDVGANLGQTRDSLRAHGYGGHILSIEPLSSAHRTLVERAKKDKSWTIASRMGLGAQTSVMDINVSQSSDFSSFLKPSQALLRAIPRSETVGIEKVEIRTIDSVLEEYCKGFQNMFLKVDTQGFEGPILEGAQQALSTIRGIQLELSLLPLYEGEKLYIDYLSDLHARGFETYMLTETGFSHELNRQLQIDVLAFR